ncbi:MAG: DUF748 domain-containing protein [Helicobacteraceae bacterium]|nr:DUF748 domain-containing protein [Helicobacteraceae bacterium]
MKLLKIIASLLLAYLFIGFVLLPYSIYYFAPKLVKSEYGASLQIQKVNFNPLTCAINIKELKLKTPRNEPFVSFKNLAINFDPLKLITSVSEFSKFDIDSLSVNILKDQKGKFNYDFLLPTSNESNKTAKTKSDLTLVISSFKLQNSELTYSYYEGRMKKVVSSKKLSFEIQNITTSTTNPLNGGYSISTLINKTDSLSLTGKIDSIIPFKIKGKLLLNVQSIPKYMQYLPESKYELLSSSLNFSSKYQFDIDDLNSTNLSDLKLKLSNIELKPKNEKYKLLSIKNIDILATDVKPFEQSANLEHISIDTISSTTIVDENSKLNWEEIFSSDTKSKHEQNTTSNTSKWKVKLAKFELLKSSASYKDVPNRSNYEVDDLNFYVNGVELDLGASSLSVEDVKTDSTNINVVINKTETIKKKEEKKSEKSSAKAFKYTIKKFTLENYSADILDNKFTSKNRVNIDKIKFSADDITDLKSKYINFKSSLRIDNKSSLELSGKVSQEPLNAHISADIKKFKLNSLNPYLSNSAYVKFYSGDVAISTKLLYGNKGLSSSGSVILDDVVLNDSRDDSVLLGLNSLKVPKYSFDDSLLFIENIDLDGLYANVEVDKNATLNFSKLMKESTQKNALSNKSAKQTSKPIEVQIITLNIKNSSTTYSDNSLPMKFKTDVHDVNGNIYAISTVKDSTTYIDVAGIVNKYGSSKISGNLNPMSVKTFTDIELEFKNLEINSLSPYSMKFAGYIIDSGKLDLYLDYQMNNSQMLGKNNLIIRDIKLGKKIESENSLPLGLAIAVFENSDGVIDLKMPIHGDVDNPNFKYGSVVIKAFGNIITSVVSSPFKLLGNLLGINTDDLKDIDYEPASFALLPSEKEKLDKIKTILIKKSAVELSIIGTYNTILDTRAIQGKKLLSRAVKFASSKYINIGGALNISILEQLYIQKNSSAKLYKLKNSFKSSDKFSNEYQLALTDALLEYESCTSKELKTVAQNRSKTIVNYLLEHGIDSSRLKVKKIEEDSSNSSKYVKSLLQITIKK